MKIGNNYSTALAFRATDAKRSFMGDVSDALDKTGEFIKTASDAIDTPEEASVKLVTNQLDNVADSKKTPSWLKSALKYLSAGLSAGVMGYSIYKLPSGIKSIASKFKLGQSVINFTANVKNSVLDKVRDNKVFKTLKYKTFRGIIKAKNFVADKFPSLSKKGKDLALKIKLDKLTKRSLLKGGIASYFAVSTWKEVLAKRNKKEELNKTDDIEVVKDAA